MKIEEKTYYPNPVNDIRMKRVTGKKVQRNTSDMEREAFIKEVAIVVG